MKNIRELTDEQVTEIARLALQDEINLDWFVSIHHGKVLKTDDYKVRIERELFDKKENLMVVRAYLDGFADMVYIAIWEDNFNIETYSGGEDAQTANQVTIVKKLIEWGFV